MTGTDVPRAIVHAGFHKTGTTSVQRLLQANAALLRPRVALGLNHAMRDVIQAARGYSRWRDPVSLAQFEFRLEQFVGTMPAGRDLCFSVEEFAGLLPGLPSPPDQPEILDYGAAPALAATIRDVLVRKLGRRAEIVFYYSTRAPDPWLTSVYWQHVKTQAMCDDLEAFRGRFRPVADLGAVVGAVAAAVPGCDVISAALDDTKAQRFGPATPILQRLALPDALLDRIEQGPPANPAPPRDVLAQMLALNRSGQGRDDLRAAKARLLAPNAAEPLTPRPDTAT